MAARRPYAPNRTRHAEAASSSATRFPPADRIAQNPAPTAASGFEHEPPLAEAKSADCGTDYQARLLEHDGLPSRNQIEIERACAAR